LSFGEVIELYGWNVWQAELLGSYEPAVSGDNPALSIDENRVVKAELLNACGKLIDLLRTMGARVTGV
jgi:hypothetical protein